jgi:phosphatidylserine decarboxylase precursor
VTDPAQIVQDLHKVIANEDRDLASLLEQSLRTAHERARAELNQKLYDALEWPQDLDAYGDYLEGFLRWIPQQTDAPAWRTSAPEERYAKEVSDRISHFFFLVDQEVDEDGAAVAQSSTAFRDWLTRFSREWGSFLNSTESFSPELLDSFLRNAPEYTVEESMVDGRPNEPSGWLTFNQFFARRLNPGLRPVADPADNGVVTSPADCSFRHVYDIDAESNIPATTIKHTHRYGNIGQLMEGSKYADAFAGGTFVHYMLPPSAYHRYHVPVAGRVEESFVVTGRVYQQVDLEDGELTSKDSTETGYEFSQTRGVLTLDTAASGLGDLGLVAVIPVGMAHVSSVNVSAAEGAVLAKGDEFGFFQFGGSDIIVLFQEGVDPEVDTSTDFRHVGSVIARGRTRP